jgi:hypothetical protein
MVKSRAHALSIRLPLGVGTSSLTTYTTSSVAVLIERTTVPLRLAVRMSFPIQTRFPTRGVRPITEDRVRLCWMAATPSEMAAAGARQ